MCRAARSVFFIQRLLAEVHTPIRADKKCGGQQKALIACGHTQFKFFRRAITLGNAGFGHGRPKIQTQR